jgi:AcrR family transcriptional regulator
VTTSPTFQRARSPQHKAERREAILAAAAQLAVRDGVRQVTLTEIAAAVGVHKSALLRYFETREQIFLELTGRAWTEWAEAMRAALGEIAPVDDGDATAGALAHGFAARPLLCDLIPHTALNLERHVSTEAVRSYKLTSLGAVESDRCPTCHSTTVISWSRRRRCSPARCTRSPPRRHRWPSCTPPTLSSGTR